MSTIVFYGHAYSPTRSTPIPEIYLKQQQIYDGTLYYLHKGITFEERWQYLYRVQVE